jgi:hypothetical protein
MARSLLGRIGMTPRDSDIVAVLSVVTLVALMGFWRILG